MGCVPFLPPRRVAMPAPSTIHLIDSGESARWGPGVLESPSLAQPCSASLSLPLPPAGHLAFFEGWQGLVLCSIPRCSSVAGLRVEQQRCVAEVITSPVRTAGFHYLFLRA